MAESSIYLLIPLQNDHSIRVLSFTGSQTAETPFQVDLEVIDLEDDAEYVTLSYCWGSSMLSENIFCGSGSHQVAHIIPLPITKNLLSALHHLRNHGIQRIWIDQVCINQTDAQERNSQVLLMQRVYQQSSHTCTLVN